MLRSSGFKASNLSKNTVSTVKHGGGSIMLWGSFCSSGVGRLHRINGIIKKEEYVDILDTYIENDARNLRLGHRWIFQNDNDPKHTPKYVQSWLQRNHISVLEWPSQSPDFNPIVNVWHELKTRVHQCHPKNLQELEAFCEEEWKKIAIEYCQTIMEDYEERLCQEQRPIKKPESNEMLIAVQSVGICGSDIHFYKEGGIEGFSLTEPIMLGHETSGIVAEVGEGVKNFKPGDRVSIEPAIFCKTCEFCKRGCFNWCSNPACFGITPTQGSLTQYFTYSADFCWKLPDKVSFDEGALIEPLACAVHGCERAEISIGDKVLICGVGTIGLLSMLTAKQMGASKICVTDISSNRLEVARNLGADHVVLVETEDTQAVITEIHQVLGGPPDITLECSGTASGISISIPVTKSGGVVVLVGLGPPNVTLPITNVIVCEVDVRGSLRYGNCYSIALDLIASGKVNVKSLITHHFKLEDTVKAYEISKKGGGAIKVMIHCNQEASV